MLKIRKRGFRKRNIKHEYYFKDKTKQEMADLADTELPISIPYFGNIIDRVHKRYPLISKVDISRIVKASIETIRKHIILGYVINFTEFIFNMRLYFFPQLGDRSCKDKLHIRVKMKTGTPKEMRKYD